MLGRGESPLWKVGTVAVVVKTLFLLSFFLVLSVSWLERQWCWVPNCVVEFLDSSCFEQGKSGTESVGVCQVDGVVDGGQQ